MYDAKFQQGFATNLWRDLLHFEQQYGRGTVELALSGYEKLRNPSTVQMIPKGIIWFSKLSFWIRSSFRAVWPGSLSGS
jgi:hypothetical protein